MDHVGAIFVASDAVSVIIKSAVVHILIGIFLALAHYLNLRAKIAAMISEIELFLLSRKAANSPLRVTTSELAASLGMPQQTLSRHLLELEAEGRINRTKEGIILLPKSVREALSLKGSLDAAFSKLSQIEISGEIVSGIGEGKYYMSLEGYKKQVKKLYGFDPYPGTLNVKLPPEEVQKRLLLRERQGKYMKGFLHRRKKLGGLISYVCHFNGTSAVAIFPEKSQHGLNVIELIGPIEYRRKFALKDGETVQLSFG